jgi:hypothetical protein
VATTVGGLSGFDSDMLLSWYCTPFPSDDYRGSQRIYSMAIPAGQSATLVLESPCDELDIVALEWRFWESDEECPEEHSSLLNCEMDDSRGGGELTLYGQVDEATEWLVMVGGPAGEQAAFSLATSCE